MEVKHWLIGKINSVLILPVVDAASLLLVQLNSCGPFDDMFSIHAESKHSDGLRQLWTFNSTLPHILPGCQICMLVANSGKILTMTLCRQQVKLSAAISFCIMKTLAKKLFPRCIYLRLRVFSVHFNFYLVLDQFVMLLS